MIVANISIDVETPRDLDDFPDAALEAWNQIKNLKAPVVEINGIYYEINAETQAVRLWNPAAEREQWA